MPARIEDYALIGDCETAALVGRDGSIDWLCWPRFDSPACFAAVLGTPEHGRWYIGPADGSTSTARRYRGDTLILETDFETADGAVTVVDFMPLRGEASDIVRVVVGRRGQVAMRTEFVARFDYGRTVPWVTRLADGGLRAIAGPDMLLLRTDVALRPEGHRTVGEFTVAAGERIPFVLTYAASYQPSPATVDAEQACAETETFWRGWATRGTYDGAYREAVVRSLVTLKALTYRPTGGTVAAPTTSLPEQLGGPRNWDYRYCWLRDATFTLLALVNAGYHEEARAWRAWLERAASGSPDQLQILYGITGERELVEWQVAWLPGYEGAAPVRVGNDASGQLQLDVFGEVVDVLYQARRGGIDGDHDAWELTCALIAHLKSVWQRPDRGIWEVRGAPQQFTHSKVMVWVAVDRAIRGAEQFGLSGPVDEWRALRARIHAEVCDRGYDAASGTFVQAYGTTRLDAALLMIPLVGFLPASDPRVQGTVAAVEQHLMRDGLVQRYDTAATDDGLPGGEGAFLACSFWLADNYVLAGRVDEARALFEQLLALRSDVGLLAEEYDPGARRLVGNFPQALSHVALVNTAFNLARAMPGARGPAQDRAHRD